MKTIDLNCDLGESFGAYKIGADEQMLELITTANVACGWHGGDPEVMAKTFAKARELGVAVGAHPGYADLWGFGRRVLPHSPGEIERFVAYQIGAAQAMAAYSGHRITHVKAHGALGNLAADNADVANAVARAVRAVDPTLTALVITGTEGNKAAERHGLSLAREIFADRAYTDRGTLVSRSEPGAVLHDAVLAAKRVLQMLEEGAVISQSGKRIPVGIDTICVHGDTPEAVAMAGELRRVLQQAGWVIKAFRSVT